MSAPQIESYSFGQIVIDGQVYNKDVIILPNRVWGGWWRIEGHVLHPPDLEAIFEVAPKTLVVGQGAYGLMTITDETQQSLRAAGIKLIARPTEQACQIYNSLREQEATGAAFHVAC